MNQNPDQSNQNTDSLKQESTPTENTNYDPAIPPELTEQNQEEKTEEEIKEQIDNFILKDLENEVMEEIKNAKIEVSDDDSEEEDKDEWVPKYKDCKCCYGFVYNCKGETCANLGQCFCKMKDDIEKEEQEEKKILESNDDEKNE